MKTFLLRLFTWWNSQTFGTQLWTWLYGEPVGEDEFGNRYYRSRNGKIDPALGYDRRWVIYNDLAEASLGRIKNGAERLAWLRATDESYRGLVRVLLLQKKDQEALALWEWYQSRPMLHSLRPDNTGTPTSLPKTGKTVVPHLSIARSNEPRLIYAVFKDGLQIWLVQNNSVQSKWVFVDQRDFEELVRDFVKKCSTESSNPHGRFMVSSWRVRVRRCRSRSAMRGPAAGDSNADSSWIRRAPRPESSARWRERISSSAVGAIVN